MNFTLSGRHTAPSYQAEHPVTGFDKGAYGSLINTVLVRRNYHLEKTDGGVVIAPDMVETGKVSYTVNDGRYTDLFVDLGWLTEDLTVT